MKRFVAFLFLLLTSTIAHSCDCKEFSQNENFNFSTNVFIGEVMDVNETGFKIKINENFKGNLKGIVSFSIEYCSIDPKKREKWLIYAGYEGTEVSGCGWSRSFTHPEATIQYQIPPFIEVESEHFRDELTKLVKDNATLQLELDIRALQDKKNNASFRMFDIYLVWVLIFSLFAIIVYLLFANRQLRKR